MTLKELVEQKRLIICVGSGGVGKTTTSAAIALKAATLGRKTLVLTIDPAKRLATALGLSELDNEERPVPEEYLEKAGIPKDAKLFAAMLDTGRSLDSLLARVAKDEELRQRVMNNNIYKQLSQSIAGSQEYVAMERLYDIMEEDKFDLVVLDTPPTKNALDFLTAPNRLVSFLDENVVQWFLKQASSSGLGGLILQKGSGIVFKLLGILTGGEFIKELTDFFQSFTHLYVGFRERANKVNVLLRDEDSVFFLVTSPEANTLDEASFFHDKLEEFGMPLKVLVVNRAYQLLKETDITLDNLQEFIQSKSMHSITNGDKQKESALKETITKLLNLKDLARQFNDGACENVKHLQDRLKNAEHLVTVPVFSEEVYDLQGLMRMNLYLFSSPECPQVS